MEDERGPVDGVAFFGGPPPSDALLEACGDRTLHVRVRPDLLSRADAQRLLDRGVQEVELDALTFHTPSLRAIDRAYAGARIPTMAQGLSDLGFRVGAVLAIGLPEQSHGTSVADAQQALGLFDTVRLHPTLVFRRSDLWQAHLDGRYEPLSLAQAVTTLRAMLDVLEPSVKVIRVGQQPGPDGLGRAVAGPVHSSLRELVEARRTLDHLRSLAADHLPATVLTIRCATVDETRTRGPFNDNVRTLRAELGLTEVVIRPDPTLERGSFVLEAS